MFVTRQMYADDQPQVAQLIHDSTNAWYQSHGFPQIFPHGPDSVQLFCEVYESLDPGCCLIVADQASGTLAGSCFYHPRSTHYALGIMNVAPAFFGKGVGSQLLRQIVNLADHHGLPIRLVSSAMNLDSFSLYNRAGFVPRAVYQDMLVRVPVEGMVALAAPPALTKKVRSAQISDVPAMSQLELDGVGIERAKDFRFFIENSQGIWRTLVIENDQNEITGFISAVRHPASNMVGPGYARSEQEATALIYEALEHHKGNQVLVLVPSLADAVIAAMYTWHARNCELHLSQVRGEWRMPTGIVIPTFMPETG